MAKQLSSIYGQALFEAAMEDGRVDELYEEVLAVRKILDENEDFLRILRHPKIPKEEKLDLLDRVFAERVSGDLAGLFHVVVEKDRQKEIPAILELFISKVKEYRGIGTAYVTAPFPLTSDQKKKLENRLLETTGYQSFEMIYQEDPSLLGGLVVRIGDRVLDSSLKTQLLSLQKDLMRVRV
jgi:F-type H+-transporting ATPase subunit delta